MIRLVGEIETTRRVRGASAPWQRVRLGVRVRHCGTPGLKLPRGVKDRRLSVVRETTLPEGFRKGGWVNLTEAETAPLIPTPEPVPEAPRPVVRPLHTDADGHRELVLAGPVLRAVVAPDRGASIRDLVLAGETEGTVASGPLRLGTTEGEEPDRGGSTWLAKGQKGLWKARFRREKAPAGELRLRQKTGKDDGFVRRTLSLVAEAPVLIDRFEVVPEKPDAKKGKKGKKRGKRRDLERVSLDVAWRGGEGFEARYEDRGRLAAWRPIPDPIRIWLFWAGSNEFHQRPGTGFVAGTCEGRAHVVLASPRETEWFLPDSRRDHPAFRFMFRRRRPPVALAAAHVVGQRIAFAGPRGFALVARTRDSLGRATARLVAFRPGLRSATLAATVEDAGTVRDLRLERTMLDGIGAVYVGALALDGDEPGAVEVRLGKEVVRP
jgi:hypothetical protein